MRRNYDTIRKQIIESLAEKPKTVNELAKEIDAKWITARRHLKWLERNKKVKVLWRNKRLILYQLLQSWI